MEFADGGLAALIGLILINEGGSYEIPRELVEKGLPDNKQFRVGPKDDDTLLLELVDVE